MQTKLTFYGRQECDFKGIYSFSLVYYGQQSHPFSHGIRLNRFQTTIWSTKKD